MENTKDLELSILSCLLIKPELMKKLILEDKHFVKHQRLWQFMKAFYKKFETFDLQLMYSICKDKWNLINSIEMVLDIEVTTLNFELYQERLIEDYNESQKNKYVIEKIFNQSIELYARNISINEFINNINEIMQDAKTIFDKE